MKSDPHFLPCTKINSKWIQDFTDRLEILKVVEESSREHFKIQAEARRSQQHRKESHELMGEIKSSCVQRKPSAETTSGVEEKVLSSYTSEKGLIVSL